MPAAPVPVSDAGERLAETNGQASSVAVAGGNGSDGNGSQPSASPNAVAAADAPGVVDLSAPGAGDSVPDTSVPDASEDGLVIPAVPETGAASPPVVVVASADSPPAPSPMRTPGVDVSFSAASGSPAEAVTGDVVPGPETGDSLPVSATDKPAPEVDVPLPAASGSLSPKSGDVIPGGSDVGCGSPPSVLAGGTASVPPAAAAGEKEDVGMAASSSEASVEGDARAHASFAESASATAGGAAAAVSVVGGVIGAGAEAGLLGEKVPPGDAEAASVPPVASGPPADTGGTGSEEVAEAPVVAGGDGAGTRGVEEATGSALPGKALPDKALPDKDEVPWIGAAGPVEAAVEAAVAEHAVVEVSDAVHMDHATLADESMMRVPNPPLARQMGLTCCLR